MIKSDKTRIYDLNIIVFDESIIKLIAAGLNLDFDTYDLSLVKESNDLPKIIDNVDLQPILGVIKRRLLNINNVSPNPYRVTRSSRRLLNLVKADNIKDTNTDIRRIIYSGSVRALTRVIIIINNTLTQRDVSDHSMITDDIIRG